MLTGIEETIRDEGNFDYIIFDTPPTGLTLRFLALPRVTITWIDRLIQIRQKILEKRYTIHRIRGVLSKEETLLSYNEGDDDVLKRLRTLKDNSQALNTILQGEDCTIVLVFNPDILSLKESKRLIEGLNDLELPLRLLIDNKLTEENIETAERVERDIRNRKDVALERVFLSKALLDNKGGKLYDIPEDIISKL